ncbi:MAG: hypothetical protein A3G32_00410 [Deltaproteobacteria bacterium RIFCSPLOWO2_12_FULL_40_28]|nr:MAG: hypothetical protein A3C45_03565 [Deltaproteobacteria bacterium RIFCSPHIGHO2_02_FULL_40_28]OGQ19184.1 MAG: hypothetical protein A3E27_02450 [Deltaproteobacteria bacterium RIFCSPHIGHO2_12_FULL_40_32]OGQ39800.1 MAG: hypothetical protein A3I69_07525 [Deltaproteobacteria bacterium RIFCSPLOWO2_02_FULL_40_36]OGQ53636.1 MAG: hypothetical protein A3G32_00410 [Deltaproteobacteria bacterium RIFCSPLOWO2_12_FULL_40_28]
MKEIFGSETKARIIKFLGMRGGYSGRQIAAHIGKSPTQVFKALHQLKKNSLIKQFYNPNYYTLNPHYHYFDELVALVYKASQTEKKYLPHLEEKRRIDPFFIYQIVKLRGRAKTHIPKLSDLLRQYYA